MVTPTWSLYYYQSIPKNRAYNKHLLLVSTIIEECLITGSGLNYVVDIRSHGMGEYGQVDLALPLTYHH